MSSQRRTRWLGRSVHFENHGQENTPIDEVDSSHHFPDISDQCSGLTGEYGSIQGLSGDTHQLLRVFINVSHGIGFVQVRVQTLGLLSVRNKTGGDSGLLSPSL